MNTNFKVIGLTRLRIKLKSTAPEADAFTTQPSKLFNNIKRLNTRADYKAHKVVHLTIMHKHLGR